MGRIPGGRGHSFGHSVPRRRPTRRVGWCRRASRSRRRSVASVEPEPRPSGDSVVRSRRRCQNVGDVSIQLHALDRAQAQEIVVGGDEPFRRPGNGATPRTCRRRDRRLRRISPWWRYERRRGGAGRDQEVCSRTVICSLRNTSGRRRTASTSARIGSDASRVKRLFQPSLVDPTWKSFSPGDRASQGGGSAREGRREARAARRASAITAAMADIGVVAARRRWGPLDERDEFGVLTAPLDGPDRHRRGRRGSSTGRAALLPRARLAPARGAPGSRRSVPSRVQRP